MKKRREGAGLGCERWRKYVEKFQLFQGAERWSQRLLLSLEENVIEKKSHKLDLRKKEACLSKY